MDERVRKGYVIRLARLQESKTLVGMEKQIHFFFLSVCFLKGIFGRVSVSAQDLPNSGAVEVAVSGMLMVSLPSSEVSGEFIVSGRKRELDNSGLT